MKSDENKVKQQLKKEFKRKEQEAFIANLPMQVAYFEDLFNHLDDKLSDTPCDHTLKFTEQFLNEHQLPLQIISWLFEHGGNCDCEVLLNVEEKFEGL